MTKKMEEKKETPPPLIGQLKEYVETRIKLAKLQAIDGSSRVAASLIADFAVVITLVLSFVFASLTLAYYLSDVLGTNWMGFGCVAILYLLIALVMKLNKKRIERPIANEFIQKIFKI
jgi:hypothetical protein